MKANNPTLLASFFCVQIAVIRINNNKEVLINVSKSIILLLKLIINENNVVGATAADLPAATGPKEFGFAGWSSSDHDCALSKYRRHEWQRRSCTQVNELEHRTCRILHQNCVKLYVFIMYLQITFWWDEETQDLIQIRENSTTSKSVSLKSNNKWMQKWITRCL